SVFGPPASLSWTDRGVSRSEATSRTSGRSRLRGAEACDGGSAGCAEGAAGGFRVGEVTLGFLGRRAGGDGGGNRPPSPTGVGKEGQRAGPEMHGRQCRPVGGACHVPVTGHRENRVSPGTTPEQDAPLPRRPAPGECAGLFLLRGLRTLSFSTRINADETDKSGSVLFEKHSSALIRFHPR